MLLVYLKNFKIALQWQIAGSLEWNLSVLRPILTRKLHLKRYEKKHWKILNSTIYFHLLVYSLRKVYIYKGLNAFEYIHIEFMTTIIVIIIRIMFIIYL